MAEETISLECILKYRRFERELTRQGEQFNHAYVEGLKGEIDKKIAEDASSPEKDYIEFRFKQNGWHYRMSNKVFAGLPQPEVMPILDLVSKLSKDLVYLIGRRMGDAKCCAQNLSKYLGSLQQVKRQEAKYREGQRDEGEAVEEPAEYFSDCEKESIGNQILAISKHILDYNSVLAEFDAVAPEYSDDTGDSGIVADVAEFNEKLQALCSAQYDESIVQISAEFAEAAKIVHNMVDSGYSAAGKLIWRKNDRWKAKDFGRYLSQKGFQIREIQDGYGDSTKPVKAWIEKRNLNPQP